MKYKGQRIEKQNFSRVVITKGEDEIALIVAPLPMGWYQHMGSLGLTDYPEVPRVVRRDDKGKLIKNAITGKVELYANDDDKEHRRVCAHISRRYVALQFVEHLRFDTNVTFDAARPDGTDKKAWLAYAEAVLKEVEESGLTEEEVSAVTTEGEKIASVIDVEEAIDDFLPQQGSVTPDKPTAS